MSDDKRREISLYYDWQGRPMNREDWIHEFERPRHIDKTLLKNGYLVSTVWIGLDHNFGFDGKPLIFETMVFKDSYSDLDMARYSTLAEAKNGHKEMVLKWSNKK